MDAPGADRDHRRDRPPRRARRRLQPRARRGKLIAQLKDAGVLCMPTIGAPKPRREGGELGADAVIAQGGEGGGHTGTVPTSLLVPQVRRSVRRRRSIAAGGFKDGRGLVAALACGAAGIAMGTRFLLTAESPVPSVTDAIATSRRGVDDVVVTTRDRRPAAARDRERAASSGSRTRGPLAKLLRSRSATRSRFRARRPAPRSRELLRSALALRQNERLTRSQLADGRERADPREAAPCRTATRCTATCRAAPSRA